MSDVLEEFRERTHKICKPALAKLRRAIAAEDERRRGQCAEIVIDRLCETLIAVYEAFVVDTALDEESCRNAADSIHGFVVAVMRSSLERMPAREEKPKCSHDYAREITRARAAAALEAHKWPASLAQTTDVDYAVEVCDGVVVALMAEAARINSLTPVLSIKTGKDGEEAKLLFLSPEEQDAIVKSRNSRDN